MNDRNTTTIAPSAALWASAFVIFALILVTAGRGGGNAAWAEMVSSAGDYTVMTTESGNDEIVLVLDERSEELLVYKILNQKEIELYQKLDLSQTFIDARRWSGRK